MQITIYHNAGCGTSRNALQAIRAAGHEPVIVEYLKTPLTRAQIAALIEQSGLAVRDAVRRKETLFGELGLDDKDVGAEELLDALAANPSLLNRPFVTVAHAGGKTMAALCRPSEMVKRLMLEPATGTP